MKIGEELVIKKISLKKLEVYMIQATFSLNESNVSFLKNFKLYGFKDKSDLVRIALEYMKKRIENQELKKSANLYAEVYTEDVEIKELTESAIIGWPE